MTEYGRIHTDGSRSGGQPIIKTQHCPNCETTKQELADYKQKVSDTIQAMLAKDGAIIRNYLGQFIIPAPKPDPLVEATLQVFPDNPFAKEHSDRIRAALDKLGFEIKEKSK